MVPDGPDLLPRNPPLTLWPVVGLRRESRWRPKEWLRERGPEGENRVPVRQVKRRAKPRVGAAPKPGEKGPSPAQGAAMFPPPALTSARLQGSALPSASLLQSILSAHLLVRGGSDPGRGAHSTHAPPHSLLCRARSRKALFKGRGCAVSALRNDVCKDARGGAWVFLTLAFGVFWLEIVRFGTSLLAGRKRPGLCVVLESSRPWRDDKKRRGDKFSTRRTQTDLAVTLG